MLTSLLDQVEEVPQEEVEEESESESEGSDDEEGGESGKSSGNIPYCLHIFIYLQLEKHAYAWPLYARCPSMGKG
jgi:hypothetical protein